MKWRFSTDNINMVQWLLRSFLVLSLVSAISMIGHAQPSVDPTQSQILFEKMKGLYGPVANKAGGEFTLDIHWERMTVAAQAKRDIKTQFHIGVDAGMLTSPRVTMDAMAMTLCHEAGHLFGGRPRRHAPPEWEGPLDPEGFSLMSAEGQADYYATASCFRKLAQGQDHREALAGKEIPQRVIQQCDSVWGTKSQDSYLCQRTAIAGYEFLVMVADFPISLAKSDSSITDKTIVDYYPARQCRLDTLFAGALCKEELPLDFDTKKNLYLGTCSQGPSARPACWYKD